MEGISIYGIMQTPYNVQKATFLEKIKIAERELIKCLNCEGVHYDDEQDIKEALIKLYKIEKKFQNGD